MPEWLMLAALAVIGAGAHAAMTAVRRRRARANPEGLAAARRGDGSPAAGARADGGQPRIEAPAPAIATLDSAAMAPLDDARTRLEINLAIAESALRSQRPRNPFTDAAGRVRAARTIRVIRTSDDEDAWAELEPLTTSGEFFHLLHCARTVGGEFSAQALMACAERLWCTRLARSADALRRTRRHADRA